MSQITSRRKYTKERTKVLQEKLKNASELLGEKACVYATGSFGRLEASSKSDLDLFIVGKVEESGDGTVKKRQLSRLDEICVKADLIEATRELEFPDFDGDGKYLAHYSVDELTKTLGKPEDDANNTLTGRLLLFLESQLLIGESAYQVIIEDVIAAYWRDFGNHKTDFMPAYLANDILRLWRTFCVNYEARTQNQPYEEKIKRKIKNYKLKHSRMLTCYSALLYLLAIYTKQGTVSPPQALVMTGLTPIQRLDWLVDQPELKNAQDSIKRLLAQYEKFLEKTSQGDKALIDVFNDHAAGASLVSDSYTFGDLMFEALYAIGKGNQFFRLIVV